MTKAEALKELEALGGERYKQTLMKNHGVKEPCFGVKIGDMKPLQKRIKVDHALALELYDTGNYDAMYFAGMIVDDARMTKKDLRRWANKAYTACLPGTTVAGTAAESQHGFALALEWIDAKKPTLAAAGWATLSHLTGIKDDAKLDLPALKQLLKRVEREIHHAPDTVRYDMNHFVIAAGCFVEPLTKAAIETAKKIGTVTADMGNNACQVPDAVGYIEKVRSRRTIGKKRKHAKC